MSEQPASPPEDDGDEPGLVTGAPGPSGTGEQTEAGGDPDGPEA